MMKVSLLIVMVWVITLIHGEPEECSASTLKELEAQIKSLEESKIELENAMENKKMETEALLSTMKEMEERRENDVKIAMQEGQAKSLADLKKMNDELEEAKKMVRHLEGGEEKNKGLKKKLDEEVEKNKALQKSELSLRDDVDRLKKRISDLKEKGSAPTSDCAGTVKELQDKLNNEKISHDIEIKKLRDLSKSNEKPLLWIAMERSKVHYEKVGVYYNQEFLPRMNQAQKAAQIHLDKLLKDLEPYTNKVMEATTPAREAFNKEYIKVKPQVDKARAECGKIFNQVYSKGQDAIKILKLNFKKFRLHAVKTCKAQPLIGEDAEQFIDTLLLVCAMIIFILTIGPIMSLVFGTIKTILYYSFCCCCCCGCGSKPAKSTTVPTPAPPQPKQQPKQQPKRNNKKQQKKGKI